MIKIGKIICYHNNTVNIDGGIFCKDCGKIIMSWSIGKPRFHLEESKK